MVYDLVGAIPSLGQTWISRFPVFRHTWTFWHLRLRCVLLSGPRCPLCTGRSTISRSGPHAPWWVLDLSPETSSREPTRYTPLGCSTTFEPARVSLEIGRNLARVGKSRLKLADLVPQLANFAPASPNVGQIRSKVGELNAEMADFAHNWPKSPQDWPTTTSCHFGSKLAESSRTWSHSSKIALPPPFSLFAPQAFPPPPRPRCLQLALTDPLPPR